VYTFQPLPTVDTLNLHIGFYLICVVVCIFAVVVMFNAETKRELLSWLGACGLVITVSGVVSYNTGSISVPRNEKVIGTFVNYQPEGFNIPIQSGKTTRRVDHHLVYVVYNIPNTGNVLFLASTGKHYPEKAVIYKN
jgi:hypothetical protein